MMRREIDGYRGELPRARGYHVVQQCDDGCNGAVGGELVRGRRMDGGLSASSNGNIDSENFSASQAKEG